MRLLNIMFVEKESKMKKFLILAALNVSGSGTIFAESGDLILDGCKAKVCTPFFEGKLSDFIQPLTFAGFEPKKIPKPHKSPKTNELSFIRFLSGVTGHTIGFVREAFLGIKDAIVDAGYEKFTGKLEGPAGAVSFEYDLKTEKWKITGD